MIMNMTRLVFFAFISLFSSICFASISNKISLADFEKYVFDNKNNSYVNGVGGAIRNIPDVTDVFEYYTSNFPLTKNRISISYDITYTADPLTTDTTFDYLAFRIFPQDHWVTHWGTTSADVSGIYFDPKIDKSISVNIDLTNFQGFEKAMGWAFVSDVPSEANIVISNIRINTIDEPGSFGLLGIGLLTTFYSTRKRRVKNYQSTVPNLAMLQFSVARICDRDGAWRFRSSMPFPVGMDIPPFLTSSSSPP